MDNLTYLLTVLAAVAVTQISQVLGIGCFVCSSVNGNEPDCEDTFNSTGRFYIRECYGARKTRFGMFPATSCIKVTGTIISTGTTIVVRQCVVDSGDVNSETEIGRSNHCGFVNRMQFNGESMSGCLLSCKTNGCNTGSIVTWSPLLFSVVIFINLIGQFWTHDH